MAAATVMRSARGGGARRPFAPVVVSPPPPSRAGNQLAPEEAVLGGAGAGGKAAKKCGSGSPPVSFTSKKTPAAAAGRVSSMRRVGSCAKRCSTPGAAAYVAPRAPVRGVSEAVGNKVRAMISSPTCSEARQERRGSEASASRKRATRSATMEEAIAGLPEPGEGRVKYLVDTFERLLFLAGGDGPEARGRGARRKNEATVTAASAPATPPGADVSYPSIASSSEVSFPGIAGVACILDASDRTSRITRARGQRRQRTYNSTGSSERGWSRKVTRVTSQHPFNLRTEQRGRVKEENFVQRLRKKQMEEERLRNPLAQGLPYTTDEPETPVKPPMKEPTEPIDLVLHSDVRAVGRSKFDHQVSCPLRCSLAVEEFLRAMHRLSSILQVAERNSFMEEVKLERERQQRVDEEFEIKQLRKEQVPRAHPMPDFTRPFVPKRSVKPKTIPREPRFQPRLMRHISKA
ncbi:hypothetical protein SETIT_3G363800v2 [Setaria italica]|uniref:TPX2 C-terminal domain-containing protein n=1 Tax=Setaria italica TaxID=4555 RepID=A0A368QMR9_SETIT|nr:uncharacterized protein LOC101771611 isoform X1 [Setaria italica]RCV19182.1 hypothetical protein SETIT_3G363800v2 [Setaria italica]